MRSGERSEVYGPCPACGRGMKYRSWWRRFFGVLDKWYCDCNAY